MFSIASSSVQPALGGNGGVPIGTGQFAFAGTRAGNQNEILLIDARNPQSPQSTTVNTPDILRNVFVVAPNYLYALIDMAALPAALDAGRPGIAALDVYDDEPLPADSALVRRDDVVLTPHLGFVNDPVFAKFGPGVVDNLLAWLKGEPLPRELKPQ